MKWAFKLEVIDFTFVNFIEAPFSDISTYIIVCTFSDAFSDTYNSRLQFLPKAEKNHWFLPILSKRTCGGRLTIPTMTLGIKTCIKKCLTSIWRLCSISSYLDSEYSNEKNSSTIHNSFPTIFIYASNGMGPLPKQFHYRKRYTPRLFCVKICFSVPA